MGNKEEPYNYIYLTACQNMLKYGEQIVEKILKSKQLT